MKKEIFVGCNPPENKDNKSTKKQYLTVENGFWLSCWVCARDPTRTSVFSAHVGSAFASLNSLPLLCFPPIKMQRKEEEEDDDERRRQTSIHFCTYWHLLLLLSFSFTFSFTFSFILVRLCMRNLVNLPLVIKWQFLSFFLSADMISSNSMSYF